MEKLFMFYLGGSAPGANIEVHDVQFVVASSPEEAYPALRDRWFGDPASLHIDAWTTLTWADGYDITVSDVACAQAERLYFINMGGSRPDEMQEAHEFGLFVASTAEKAKQRALNSLLNGVPGQHRDDMMDVDDCLALVRVDERHVHLSPSSGGRSLRPEFQGFIPLDSTVVIPAV